MIKRCAVSFFVAISVSAVALSAARAEPKNEKKEPKKKAKKQEDAPKDETATAASALGFTMKDIDGKEQDLHQYAGKVVLMVNVASRCGFTPQYKGLQAMYEKYKDKGLVVLGFPANDFNKQEPGTNEEIKSFCMGKFNVSFPMFAKVHVKGKEICPLYKYLTSKSAGHKFGGEIPWNFNKFLVGRDGEIVGRFEHSVTPEDDKMVQAVEKALGEGESKPRKSKSKPGKGG